MTPVRATVRPRRAPLSGRRLPRRLSSGHAGSAWPAFFLGLGAFVFVNAGGRISVLELTVAVYVLFYVISAGVWPPRTGMYAVAAGGLLLGMLVANAWWGRGTEGVAVTFVNYAVLILLILGIWALIQGDVRRRLQALLIGSALSQFIGYVISPTTEVLIDPWKFGMGYAATILLLVGVDHAFRNGAGVGWVWTFTLAVVTTHLIMGTRSLAGITFMVTALLMFQRRSRRGHKVGVLGYVLLFALVAVIFPLVYDQIAASGMLGPEATAKWEDQNGDYGALLGARKEMPLLVVAWLNSPLFGWGPLGMVDKDITVSLYSWYIRHNYAILPFDYARLFAESSLPLHSVALGALVRAGLCALPLVIELAKNLIDAVRTAVVELGILVTFAVVNGAWHFLVSPLGDITRFPLAVAAAVGLVAVQRAGSRVQAVPGAVTRPRRTPPRTRPARTDR